MYLEVAMEEIIRIDNLIFEFPGDEETPPYRAIDDISLQIEKGSFTAVLGRNGSGKSTMAKTMNALLLPTEGTVYVNGKDTSVRENIWDVRQTAGMVFQNPDNQLVSSIVEDDVAFGPENLGVESGLIRERVDDALEAVEMYDLRKKAPHMLSGGQKQRVAIAGVVAMRPECIIFDEPTAMLDPRGRAEVLSIISRLHKAGVTIILITHFMEEAAAADRVVILDSGHVLLDGSPQEVFSDPDRIRSYGLELPVACDVADRLRKKGMDIPKDVIDQKGLVEAICQLK